MFLRYQLRAKTTRKKAGVSFGNYNKFFSKINQFLLKWSVLFWNFEIWKLDLIKLEREK